MIPFDLTRPLVIPDTETTGTNTEADRIIEIGMRVHAPGQEPRQWRTFVNPGVPIPPASTQVHHITDAMVTACRNCCRSRAAHDLSEAVEETASRCEGFRPWPTFRQLAQRLADGFTGVDFAGKNVRFDLRIIAAEMARAGVPWSYAGARIVDIDRIEQLGEPRDLSSLYRRRVGREPVNAHSALDDVMMSEEILEAQFAAFGQLSRDLDALHALQWPGWVDAEGKFRRREDGVVICSFGQKYNGRPIREIPPDFWRGFILKAGSTFSAEIKAIARDALEGRYP